MNEAQRASASRRESSDFSIDRILSKDVTSTSTSSSTSVDTKEVIDVPGQACTSHLNRSVEIHHSSQSFVVQNKLDWLRNFCKLQPQKLQFQDDKSTAAKNSVNSNTELVKRTDDSDPVRFNGEELSWLRCTRYCPPKLPRKSCAGKNLKRKPGSHPRIPFTKYQLEVLEEKYKIHAYLSRKDVVHLSDLLHLPQSRIKIWFQNRRARERRESQMHEQTQRTII